MGPVQDPQYFTTFDLTPTSTNVPDGGTTIGLLGLALTGLGAVKRGKFLAR